MKQGRFYFIEADYFKKYDPDKKLMGNKPGEHNRPCYYVFPDAKEPAIMWCVPISSQVEKYSKIAHDKVQSQLRRGKKDPSCDTLCFGKVLGNDRAFLIQNMFPVSKDYISKIYLDRNSNKPVPLHPKVAHEIEIKTRKILKLVQRGYGSLVFSDILKTRENLIQELHDRDARKEKSLDLPQHTTPVKLEPEPDFLALFEEVIAKGKSHQEEIAVSIEKDEIDK